MLYDDTSIPTDLITKKKRELSSVGLSSYRWTIHRQLTPLMMINSKMTDREFIHFFRNIVITLLACDKEPVYAQAQTLRSQLLEELAKDVGIDPNLLSGR